VSTHRNEQGLACLPKYLLISLSRRHRLSVQAVSRCPLCWLCVREHLQLKFCLPFAVDLH
jgi:hypothetical protein